MNNEDLKINEKDDEISLLSLIGVLWKHKLLIIITTLVAIVGVIVFCIISLKLPPEKSFYPNVYTPKAEMLINDSSSSGSSLSSMINSSGLGGLASLAGYSGGAGSSNSALASYLIHSNSILDDIVDHFNLIEKWEIEKNPRANSRDALKKQLSASYDNDTGIFSIEYKDIDPVFARDVINYAVDLLEKRFNELGIDKNKLSYANLEENINNSYNNILSLQKEIQKLEYSVTDVYSANGTPSIVTETEIKKLELEVQKQIYTSSKAQLESLKITMASEQPVFQTIEYAEIPDRKSGPSRGKLCIIVTFAAFFVSVFASFLINAIKNIKNDPDAIKQLKGEK